MRQLNAILLLALLPIGANALSIVPGPYCAENGVDLYNYDEFHGNVRMSVGNREDVDGEWLLVTVCTARRLVTAHFANFDDAEHGYDRVVRMIASADSHSLNDVAHALDGLALHVGVSDRSDDTCICSESWVN